jgi:hypothetical protein
MADRRGAWLLARFQISYALCHSLVPPPADGTGGAVLKKKIRHKKGLYGGGRRRRDIRGLGILLFTLGWTGRFMAGRRNKKTAGKAVGASRSPEGGEDRLYGFIVAAPPEFQEFLVNAAERLNEGLTGFPAQLYARLMGAFGSLVASAPRSCFHIAASAIGTFFLSAASTRRRPS